MARLLGKPMFVEQTRLLLVQKLIFAEYNPGHPESDKYEQNVEMIRWLRFKGADPYRQNAYGRDVFYSLKNLSTEVKQKISQLLE